LPQHGVYQGCLAVVNMGNDGDIAYRLGHRIAFPSFGSALEAIELGRQEGELPHIAALLILSAAEKGAASRADDFL
jgi:hypothetical protein